jgi:hypothetical protein
MPNLRSFRVLLGESSVYVKSGPDKQVGSKTVSALSDELSDLGLQLNLYCKRQQEHECQPVGSVHEGIRYVLHDSWDKEHSYCFLSLVGGNMTFIQGYGSINTKSCTDHRQCLPNMYNQNSTLTLMGTIIGTMTYAGFTEDELAALGLNQLEPLNVEILTYSYYDELRKPLDTSPYYANPPTLDGSEYNSAQIIDFTFQLVLMGLNESQVYSFVHKLSKGTPYWNLAMTKQYSYFSPAVVSMGIETSYLHYLADPITTHKNAGVGMHGSSPAVWISLAVACAASMLLQLL